MKTLLVLQASAGLFLFSSGIFFPSPMRAAMSRSAMDLPLRFEPNRGQSPAGVLFQARGPGHALFLNRNGATLSAGHAPDSPAFTLTWKNSSRNPQPRGAEPLPGKSNYFLAHASPVRHVPHFGKVVYPGVYPGIDVVFYGNSRRVEFDFVVAAGADPSRIEMAWNGQQSARLTPEGDLELAAGTHRLLKKRPVAYQTVGGQRLPVAASYVLAANRVRFQLGRYDRKLTLTIDPVLVYSSFTDYGETDFPYAVAVDAAGNAYVTGWTSSYAAPTAATALQRDLNGGSDACVLKLSRDGNAVLYATYLGGGSSETGYAIAVDRDGSAVVAGSTYSTDFPVTEDAFQRKGAGSQDAFIARLSPAGDRLVYSTYLGGSSSDYASALALGPDGSVTVGGNTYSTNFPLAVPVQKTNGGGSDAFIARLNPAGNALEFSTYWGGSGTEYLYGLAVDSRGLTYVTGETYSANFPTVNPLQQEISGTQDIFVLKLGPGGASTRYSTYIGGSLSEIGNAIVTNEWGQATVVGYTRSKDFPVTPGAFQTTHAGYLDGVVFTLSEWGDALLASTFYGGANRENLFSVARDPAGNIVATGFTTSLDLPVRDPVFGWHQGSPRTLFLTNDGGQTWNSDISLPADSIRAIVSDPQNPDILYAASWGDPGGILRSSDGGLNWTAGEWDRKMVASTVEVDPGAPSRLWAGTNYGVVRSEDSGATWSAPLVAGTVNAITVDPRNPSTVFAAIGTRLYKSTDSGTTWSIPRSNLPGFTINTIAISPLNSQVMYAGLASAYPYSSQDGGATWWQMPVPYYSVYQIEFDKTGTVYMAGSMPNGIGGSSYMIDASGRISGTVLISKARVNHFAVRDGDPVRLYAAIDGEGVKRWAWADLWREMPECKLVHPFAVWLDPRNPDRMLAGGVINSDVTVAKFTPDLSQLLFSTYFGGSGNDDGRGVAVDSSGNIYITGATRGLDFPVTPNAIPPLYNGGRLSAFLFKLAEPPPPEIVDPGIMRRRR